MKENLIDSTVVVAFLKKELSGEAKRQLEESESHISIISFAEVARFFHLAGKSRDWNVVKAALAEEFDVLGLSKRTCELAAAVAVKTGLALADSLIYATALENGLPLVSRDGDFKGLKHAVIVA